MEPPLNGPAMRICGRMKGDHQDLDERWTRFDATPASDLAARRMLFASFRSDLLHHIRIEEDTLFPRMIETDPGQRTLVERLLEEHERIRDVLRRIAEALESGTGPIDELSFELVNELGEHNAREEATAYPWLDDHLSPSETAEMIRRLEDR